MHITGDEKLNKFARRHSTARSVLQRWYVLMTERTFESFEDLRQTFPQVDRVRGRAGKFAQMGERTTLTVFNIGRQFRLIAFVDYENHRVIIRHVLTHDEYMRDRWKG